jgi:hypothetical protein
VTAVTRVGTGIDRAVRDWRTFWFEPTSSATLGAVRIAFAAVVVVWTLSLLPDLTALFGDEGVAAGRSSDPYAWGLFDVDGIDPLLVWSMLLAGSLALLAGWHSRLAALVVVIGLLSFDRANPYALNTGDGLLRLEAVYLTLAPCGAAFSLDRRRTAGSFWSAQVRAPWVLRLLQVQLSVIYLSSVLNKLSGFTWREGTAVSYALRQTDIGTVTLPDWLTTQPLLMNAATWGVLAAELAIGVLVWNRRARPWVLAIGLVLHLLIGAVFAVAFFSAAMLVLYVAFVPPATVERLASAAGLLEVEDGVAAGG